MAIKLTHRTLKQIIREEIDRVLSEEPRVRRLREYDEEEEAQQCLPTAWGSMCHPSSTARQSMARAAAATPGVTTRPARTGRRRKRGKKCGAMRRCRTPDVCASRSEQSARQLYKMLKQFPAGSGASDWRVIQHNHDKGANVLQIFAKAICYAERAVLLWEKSKYACSKLGPYADTPAGDGQPFSPGSNDCFKRVKLLKRRIQDLRYFEESLINVDSDPSAVEHLKGFHDEDPVKKAMGAHHAAEKERKKARARELGL